MEPYLVRCIQSILEQTFADFELILVDDGSPDACSTVCDYYTIADERVKVVHQKNSGLSVARNVGLDCAVGDFISFVDSDDWVHCRYLELLLQAIDKNDVCISAGNMEFVPEGGRKKNEGTISVVEKIKTKDYWLNGCGSPVGAWGKLMCRSMFDGYKYPAGKLYEDAFVTHRILFQVEEIAVVRDPIYFYNLRQGSITRSAWTKRRCDEFEALYSQYQFFSEMGDDELREHAFEGYLGALYNCVRGSLASGNIELHKSLKGKLKHDVRSRPFPSCDNLRKNDAMYFTVYPVRARIMLYGYAFLRRIKLIL